MKTIIFLLIIFSPLSIFSKKTWVKKATFGATHFDLKCVDSLNCYTFVDSSASVKIYKSSDQGNTWFEIYKKIHYDYNTGERYDSVLTLRDGYAIDKKQIYMTYTERSVFDIYNDEDKTIRRLTFGDLSANPDIATFQDIKMYDDKLGLAEQLHGFFLTKDGWNSYERIEYESIGQGNTIFFIDSNNIAFSKYHSGYTFWRYNITEDSWSIYNKGEPDPGPNWGKAKYLYTIEFINDTLAFAVGIYRPDEPQYPNDIIYKTTNRGKKWEIIYNQKGDPPYGVTRIAFRTALHGFVAGDNKILETTDGGESWISQDSTLLTRTAWKYIDFAGEYLLLANQRFIYRLQNATGVELELSRSKNIIIRQNQEELLIAIEDAAFKKYTIQIYDLQGMMIKEKSLSSGIGKLFQPININDIPIGTYLYRISTLKQPIKTGSFIIAK